MGLIASVYKDSSSNYDCTLNGVTNRFSRVCIVNVDGPFKPRDDCPAVMLEPGYWPGTVMIRPLEVYGKQSMFGGNFISTSDSRFSRAIEKITGHPFYGAVPIHDRVEG